MRKQDEEGEGRQGQRRRQQKGLPITPLLLLGVLLVGTILLARQIAQQQGQEDEVEEGPELELFSNVPEEEPPVPGGWSGPSPSSREIAAPSVLAEDATWVKALEVGAEADALLAEANRAREGGDRTTWNRKGKAAKEAYDRAWTMTMELEEEFAAKYDDRDRVLRKLKRQREEWNQKKITLHKTTAR